MDNQKVCCAKWECDSRVSHPGELCPEHAQKAERRYTHGQVVRAWDRMLTENPHLFNAPGEAWRAALLRSLADDGKEGGK